MAALHVAQQAISAARWSEADLKNAALVLGTSRGNAASCLSPWPGRRPLKLMAVSNSIHSEPATAISILFGITGPNHVLASGCAAGLDAAGLAMMLINAGLAQRALAVAVDLPLVPALLDHYTDSGLLSSQYSLDPYHPDTTGFVPAEGAAAIAMETNRADSSPHLLYYACNADACDPLGIPAGGGNTPLLIKGAILKTGPCHFLAPHATGTAVQAIAEPAAFHRAGFSSAPSLHLLKPYLGHCIGASGLLESVIIARFLQEKRFPPNLPGLHVPEGFSLPTEPLTATSPIFKLSHGMGGHNSLLVLAP